MERLELPALAQADQLGHGKGPQDFAADAHEVLV